MDYNYGQVIISKSAAVVQIRDINGEVAQEKTLDFSDLTFNADLLRFDALCLAK